MAAARRALQRRQRRLDPRRLVFIDETSVSTTITRLYGRAPQGERLVQKVLHGNWKTVTFIAALRHNRVTAPFVIGAAAFWYWACVRSAISAPPIAPIAEVRLWHPLCSKAP